jgi:hypothetical protein
MIRSNGTGLSVAGSRETEEVGLMSQIYAYPRDQVPSPQKPAQHDFHAPNFRVRAHLNHWLYAVSDLGIVQAPHPTLSHLDIRHADQFLQKLRCPEHLL